MAAAPLTRDERGQLVVPSEPIVPVITGDGVGPETWAAAKRILEAAVTKAYGKARRVDWRELPAGRIALEKTGSSLPKETIDTVAAHLVSLIGPFESEEGGGSPGQILRRRLGLAATEAVVRTLAGAPSTSAKLDVRVWWDQLEHAAAPLELAPGLPATASFLRMLRDRANDAFLRLRFGSRERVESYLRSSGRRDSPLVEVALALQPVSWAGAHRLALTVIRQALADKRRRITVVHRTSSSPQTEGAFRDWVLRVAEEEFMDDTFTSNALARLALRVSETVAERERDAVVDAGGVYVEEATFDEALQTLLATPNAFDTVVGTAETGAIFARLLALRVGGAALVPTASFQRETGRASFGILGGANVGDTGQDRASAAAFVLAGEQLLRHLGWKEAADAALQALERALSKGRLPPDLAKLAPGSTVVTAAQFADAALAAV